MLLGNLGEGFKVATLRFRVAGTLWAEGLKGLRVHALRPIIKVNRDPKSEKCGNAVPQTNSACMRVRVSSVEGDVEA